jgi:hypothetical protein
LDAWGVADDEVEGPSPLLPGDADEDDDADAAADDADEAAAATRELLLDGARLARKPCVVKYCRRWRPLMSAAAANEEGARPHRPVVPGGRGRKSCARAAATIPAPRMVAPAAT